MARPWFTDIRPAREGAILLAATLALFWLARSAGQTLSYQWHWSVIPQFLAYNDPDTGA